MTLLTLLCTAPPATWAAAADILPVHRAEVWRELHGLGLVDDDGPTDLGRRLAAVSAGTLRGWQALPEPPQPRKARQKALQADGAPAASAARPRAAPAAGAMPRGAVVRDFETWTAALAAAQRVAEISCRSSARYFMHQTVSAHIPAAWANCKIFGGTKRGPRDLRVPRAEFWPGGTFPVGLVVAEPALAKGPEHPGSDATPEAVDAWAVAWGMVWTPTRDGAAAWMSEQEARVMDAHLAAIADERRLKTEKLARLAAEREAAELAEDEAEAEADALAAD